MSHAESVLRLLALHRYEEAEGHARHHLSRDPEDPAMSVLLARVLLARGLAEEALALLADTLERTPDHVETMAWLAYALAHHGDAAAGYQLLERVAPVMAGQPVVEVTLAQRAFAGGDVDTALTHLQRATFADPGFMPALRSRARVLDAAGRRGEAAVAWKNVVRIWDGDEEAWVSLVDALRALGDSQSALTEIELAMRALPGSEAMRTALQELRRDEPATDEVAVLLRTFRAQLDHNDITAARQVSDQLLRNHLDDPRARFVRLEIEVAFPVADPARLMRELLECVKTYPSAWEPHAMLAQSLMRMDGIYNAAQALTHAESAWSLSAHQPRAGWVLFMVLLRIKRHAQAFALARLLEQSDDPDVAALVHHVMGQQQQNTGG